MRDWASTRNKKGFSKIGEAVEGRSPETDEVDV